MIRPFNECYAGLLRGLLALTHAGEYETRTYGEPKLIRNKRTNTNIAVLPEAFFAFHVDLRDGLLPMPDNRRVFPKTAAAEVAWFLSGEDRVTWLRKHAPIWDKFVEEDGETVAGAYGYRWRRHFGRDQIRKAAEALEEDATDRRVLVSAWDPATDGLGVPAKNAPCPTHFTLSVDTSLPDPECWTLNSAVFVRSSDVFVGLPYDVMGHALLLRALATELDLGPGIMHFTLAHPHMYETHFKMARESLEYSRAGGEDVIAMPIMWGLRRIEEDPDGYVETVKALGDLGPRHPFNPRPEVVL